jgi:hypothetical protein
VIEICHKINKSRLHSGIHTSAIYGFDHLMNSFRSKNCGDGEAMKLLAASENL